MSVTHLALTDKPQTSVGERYLATAGAHPPYLARMSKDHPLASEQSIERLERSLQRLDNRVRRWSNTRWAAPGADGRPRAELAYDLAVTLAELARRAGNGAPPMRPMQTSPHGLADQLAVLGRELTGAPEVAGYVEAAAAAVERVSAAL
jgi:hypothetical protein